MSASIEVDRRSAKAWSDRRCFGETADAPDRDRAGGVRWLAGERALALAGRLAFTFEAKVTLLHVIAGVPQAISELRENLVAPELRAYADLEHRAVNDAMWALGEELTGQGARRLRDMGVEDVRVAIEVGDAAARIVDYAQHNGVTQIVLGRRGLSGIERIFLGSVCDKVVRLAPCACISVP